jgi:hypothetical protein
MPQLGEWAAPCAAIPLWQGLSPTFQPLRFENLIGAMHHMVLGTRQLAASGMRLETISLAPLCLAILAMVMRYDRAVSHSFEESYPIHICNFCTPRCCKLLACKFLFLTDYLANQHSYRWLIDLDLDKVNKEYYMYLDLFEVSGEDEIGPDDM